VGDACSFEDQHGLKTGTVGWASGGNKIYLECLIGQ
jgi:hypothetical protein